MGIDYGTKRIGLALSDDSGVLAFPHKIIESSPGALDEVLNIVKDEKVDRVVIGESKDFKGVDNRVMADVEDFKKGLEENDVEVHLEPEYLTSVESRRDAPKGIKTDDVAAALILQRYLEKLNNNK